MDPSDDLGASGPSQTNREQIRKAADAINHCLENQVYAIVGSAACSLLGSGREIEDIDIVVPKNDTKNTRQMLANEPTSFEVERRTLYTYYTSEPKIAVQIISPPFLFEESFDKNTPVILVNMIKVLKPSLILNARCKSILDRPSEDKITTDAADIKFCLSWCANNKLFPTAKEVPRASRDFVQWFIGAYGDVKLWIDAGYNWTTWSFKQD